MSVNERPFRYVCVSGSRFTAARSDLSGGLRVDFPPGLSPEDQVRDIMLMTAHFMSNVYPNLKGFDGFGALKIEIRRN